MPRILVVAGEDTPVAVETAAKAFQSPLRMHLIRHYLAHSGSQRKAVRHLGVSQRAVSTNTRALVEAGVLVEVPTSDGRLNEYQVDVARVQELLVATKEFTIGAGLEDAASDDSLG